MLRIIRIAALALFALPLAAQQNIAIVSQARGASIQARFVRDGDENRVTGNPGYPWYLNPYGSRFGAAVSVQLVLSADQAWTKDLATLSGGTWREAATMARI